MKPEYEELYDAAYDLIAEVHDKDSPQYLTVEHKFLSLVSDKSRVQQVAYAIFLGAREA